METVDTEAYSEELKEIMSTDYMLRALRSNLLRTMQSLDELRRTDHWMTVTVNRASKDVMAKLKELLGEDLWSKHSTGSKKCKNSPTKFCVNIPRTVCVFCRSGEKVVPEDALIELDTMKERILRLFATDLVLNDLNDRNRSMRKQLKAQRKALSAVSVLCDMAMRELFGEISRILPYNLDLSSEFWGYECEDSPTGRCVYPKDSRGKDVMDDDLWETICVICLDPATRK